MRIYYKINVIIKILMYNLIKLLYIHINNHSYNTSDTLTRWQIHKIISTFVTNRKIQIGSISNRSSDTTSFIFDIASRIMAVDASIELSPLYYCGKMPVVNNAPIKGRCRSRYNKKRNKKIKNEKSARKTIYCAHKVFRFCFVRTSCLSYGVIDDRRAGLRSETVLFVYLFIYPFFYDDNKLSSDPVCRAAVDPYIPVIFHYRKRGWCARRYANRIRSWITSNSNW